MWEWKVHKNWIQLHTNDPTLHWKERLVDQKIFNSRITYSAIDCNASITPNVLARGGLHSGLSARSDKVSTADCTNDPSPSATT